MSRPKPGAKMFPAGLFPDAEAKSVALREHKEDRRYRHGILIIEPKLGCVRSIAAMRPTCCAGDPSNQILSTFRLRKSHPLAKRV